MSLKNPTDIVDFKHRIQNQAKYTNYHTILISRRTLYRSERLAPREANSPAININPSNQDTCQLASAKRGSNAKTDTRISTIALMAIDRFSSNPDNTNMGNSM
jgi:hypothetical protein